MDFETSWKLRTNLQAVGRNLQKRLKTQLFTRTNNQSKDVQPCFIMCLRYCGKCFRKAQQYMKIPTFLKTYFFSYFFNDFSFQVPQLFKVLFTLSNAVKPIYSHILNNFPMIIGNTVRQNLSTASDFVINVTTVRKKLIFGHFKP